MLGEELTPVWQGQAIAQAATANIKRRVDPLLAEGQRQLEALEKDAEK